MLLGFLFAVGACFVWGLIFIIPQFLGDFSAVEVVLGRYLAYGILSSALLFRKGFTRLRCYTLRVCGMVALFALFSNVLYYLGIIGGLRFVSPQLTVLLVGMAPIVIAIYGNWSVREISYQELALPCIGIGFGVVLINISEIDWHFKTHSFQQYLLGFTGVIVALVGWSWYAVSNARFLKRHPHIPSSEWSTVIGVGTLIWTFVLAAIFALGMKSELSFNKFLSWSPSTLHFLGGVLILGVVCSWLGCFLWNRASVYLPVSLMGPFLIFETIFGLSFVYMFQKRMPTWIELLGVGLMLSGILRSVYVFRKKMNHT